MKFLPDHKMHTEKVWSFFRMCFVSQYEGTWVATALNMIKPPRKPSETV